MQEVEIHKNVNRLTSTRQAEVTNLERHERTQINKVVEDDKDNLEKVEEVLGQEVELGL